MKAAVLLVLFISAIFAQTVVLNIGGTTCIPDDADTCTPRTGSSMVTLTGGVNVDTDGACDAGSADTMGIATTLTIEEDGFYNTWITGVGGFKNDESAAFLLFDGDVATDSPCDAIVAVPSANGLAGFWTAGDYSVVVTSNNGAADACGEFGVTITMTDYEYMGTTNEDVAFVADYGFGCSVLGNRWVYSMEYTPDADGTYNAYGQGRLDGETTTVFGAMWALTSSLPENMTSSDAMCNATVLSIDLTTYGYVLTAGETYTVFISDVLPANQMAESDVWFNIVMTEETAEVMCDRVDYDDQTDFLRPQLTALSVTEECVEDTSEYYFDVRQTSFDTDQFVIVDTLSCSDSERSSVDGAVILYYGAVGSERDGDTPAVAPEEPCTDFIIGGDSGDGGAVFYWFPAEADLTIVPTTWSSGASGGITLTVANYDIVGCVPENPFLPAEPTDVSSTLAFVALAVFLVALF